MFRIFTILATLILPLSAQALATTKVEYQLNLDRTKWMESSSNQKAAKRLFNWMDKQLEDDKFKGKIKIKLDSIKIYARKTKRIKFGNDPQYKLKYRELLDKDNDLPHSLVWKIRPVDLTDSAKPWHAHPHLVAKSRWKLEKNVWCNGEVKNEYSVWIEDVEPFDTSSTTAVNNYFPHFGEWYGYDATTTSNSEEQFEWIADIKTEWGKHNVPGKITIQLTYDTHAQFESGNISETTNPPELTFKAKRIDAGKHWEETDKTIEEIFKHMIQTPHINREKPQFCNI